MIYVVTKNTELHGSNLYEIITVEKSLTILFGNSVWQYDSETEGRDPHLCKLLTMQFGSIKDDIQIVVDCTTIDPKLYKDVLERSLLIGHNLKFDLQFLYNYSIIPRNVYDTMIVEQFLHLGFPAGTISYSLKNVALRRLDVDIDKTIRGQIQWRGVCEDVIVYAAGDVVYLYPIMLQQIKECREKGGIIGAKLECDFTPAIAYLEWCGIHLDADKWKAKMEKDRLRAEKAEKAINDFMSKCFTEGITVNKKGSKGFHPVRLKPEVFSSFVHIDRQGDLFLGYDLTPKVTVNWSSSQQVVQVAKLLGFDTVVQDKKTGEDKDSVINKHLSNQKGICDEFLKLYFEYQGATKIITSFGQGHLNTINPVTGRSHTVYRAIGTASGRMSSGSQQPNEDLAKVLGIPPKECTYPNYQQLPHDAETRACFTSEKGRLFCSCDYSARLNFHINNKIIVNV